MKNKDFLVELDQRLEENKRLYEHPGVGKVLGPITSLVGLHAFKVLGVASFGMTLGLFVFGRHQLRVMNEILFGWL